MLRKKKIDSYEFLPSAIEIVERPTSPGGRIIVWTIFSIIMTLIIWSIVSKVDVVATTTGKIIPEGKIKTIQPLEEGVIKEIFVVEGQQIKKGDILAEFDSTMKKADAKAIDKTLNLYRLEKYIGMNEIQNNLIELDYLLKEYSGLENEKILSEYNNYISRKNKYQGDREELALTIKRTESELMAARSNLLKSKNEVLLLITEEKNYRELKDIGGIVANEWVRKKTELDIARNEEEKRRYDIERLEITVSELEKRLLNLNFERELELSDKIVALEKEILSLEGQLTKIEKQDAMKKIYSPVNGRVNEIAINTIGGIVSPGSSIMSIVPDELPLIIEVWALNKDIGFIKVGQDVEVKLDTFPFQKHGILEGRVVKISPDSFQDEKVGLKYKVMVVPVNNKIKYQDKVVQLNSGMSLTGEIKTGKRRVIEFFLSPLMKYADESLKVR